MVTDLLEFALPHHYHTSNELTTVSVQWNHGNISPLRYLLEVLDRD